MTLTEKNLFIIYIILSICNSLQNIFDVYMDKHCINYKKCFICFFIKGGKKVENNSTNAQNQGTTSPLTTSYNSAQSNTNQVNSTANQNQAQNTTQASSNNQQANITDTMNQQSGIPQAVVGLFSSLNAARESAAQLRQSGFTIEEINIISKEKTNDNVVNNMGSDDSIADGTMAGGAIGGIGGLLLSAGALTIPGIGPIIAAGPIAATIAGAVGGGITGGLIDWGIPSDKSEEYNNEVAYGKTLAVIKTDANKVQQAIQIMNQNGAMNVETHNAK